VANQYNCLCLPWVSKSPARRLCVYTAYYPLLFVPIVALTANAMKGDDQKCLDAGMDDYMAKPIKRDKLAEVLTKYLSQLSSTLPPSVTDTVDIIKGEVDQLNKSICDTVSQSDEMIIDWAEVTDRMGNDGDLVAEIADAWLEDNPSTVASLAEAVKAKDAGEITSLAHKVKGSSATISANGLASAALPLETAGREGKLDNIDNLFDEVQKEFDKVQSFITQPDWVEVAKKQAN